MVQAVWFIFLFFFTLSNTGDTVSSGNRVLFNCFGFLHTPQTRPGCFWCESVVRIVAASLSQAALILWGFYDVMPYVATQWPAAETSLRSLTLPSVSRPQSCPRCCGPWWCAWASAPRAWWASSSSPSSFSPSPRSRLPFSSSWKACRPSCTHCVCTGKLRAVCRFLCFARDLYISFLHSTRLMCNHVFLLRLSHLWGKHKVHRFM